MGKKRSFWDNPFGGLFDFNHDGKEDLAERWLAFKIFEECTKKEETPCSFAEECSYSPTDVSWRDDCEDGSEYGLDPEDYDTEEEYEEALLEAQDDAMPPEDISQLSEECQVLDGQDELKESDFPNKRRYIAAYTLANEYFYYSDKKRKEKEKACCRFILENADKITAANYLSNECGFLYAQAIKDHFSLPVSLPDEDECREYELEEALCKIAKRDITLSFKVWEWVLETFLPYSQYADGAREELTSSVIDALYDFPENYGIELVRYIDGHPDFTRKVISEDLRISNNLGGLVAIALQDRLTGTARHLFQLGLKQAGTDWKKINSLTSDVIEGCQNYDELESAEYFKLHLLPLVKMIHIGMVQDEIEDWEKSLDMYISQVEDECEQYAYTRKNSWRKTVPDGTPYGLDPRYYDTEQEYMAALNEEKYGWREWYREDDTLGLDVDAYETEEEYKKAYDIRLEEKQRQEREQNNQKTWMKQEQEQSPPEGEYKKGAKKDAADEKIYTFCGVVFSHGSHPYHYRTDDRSIEIGDKVLVPAGNLEVIGKVVSIGQYMRIAAPYPVDQAKFVIRIVKEDGEE